MRDATDWNNIVLATFRQFEACHKIQWIAAMSKTDSVVNGAVCNIIQREQDTCVGSLPGVEDAVTRTGSMQFIIAIHHRLFLIGDIYIYMIAPISFRVLKKR